MQLITTRNKEISFAELKKAISSGNGLKLIRPGDKFAIELKNGELVNAVCGGYVNEKRARFVLEDSLAEKWRMNDTPTNKGGYLKSEGAATRPRGYSPAFPGRARGGVRASLHVRGNRRRTSRVRGYSVDTLRDRRFRRGRLVERGAGQRST